MSAGTRIGSSCDLKVSERALISAISDELLQIPAVSSLLNWGGPNSNPCNGWTGVSCDASGAISALNLLNVPLGTLPSSLYSLTSLKSLSLKGCGA